MIEMGLIVGLGLLITLYKMSWKWKLRVLSHSVISDIGIFILLIALHWGTFSGVMVATIGALMCSVILGTARKVFGYCESGVYKPGLVDISSKLNAP